MKKNYITPEISVIQPESLLCNLVTTSVFQESTEGECIGKFDVVNEDATKTGADYKDLWGNSDKWGDD